MTTDVGAGLARVGGWLFRRRTWLPLPIIAALLLAPTDIQDDRLAARLTWIGAVVVAAGEGLRLWAVRHIGVISRTRSDRLGPLVASGPFSHVRNPLYVGNILLWVGLALSARLVRLAPVAAFLLAFAYHAIVRWEELLLEQRIGDSYGEYARRVPRWIPRVTGRKVRDVRRADEARFSWSATFFSERGTLLAIVAGYLLLWAKDRL